MTGKETLNIAILHNIISPYKTLLFNELCDLRDDFLVIYAAKTESIRDWTVDLGIVKFKYDVLFDIPANKITPLSLFLATWRRLCYLRPEVVVLGGYSEANYWAGFVWAKLHQKKLILWSSSNESDHKRYIIREQVKKFIVKGCNAFNVYGSNSRNYLVKLGAEPHRIFATGNNTDNSFYSEEVGKRRALRDTTISKTGNAKKNFIYIGRLSPEKNVLGLLSAYSRVFAENAEWGLILVGDGPQLAAVKEYVRENSLPRVSIVGFKQKKDIPQYLALSDVMILPSFSETWGLVVNEAMAAGLPVFVSKKCGCYPDIVKEGENGFSFNPNNTPELTTLMLSAASGTMDLGKMGRRSMWLISKCTPESSAKVVSETIEFSLVS